MKRLFSALLWCAWLGLGGCVIGTWPTPEDRPDREVNNGGHGGLQAEESCGDGLDNDADGSVDEGCDCNDNVRGCILVAAGQCAFGVQRCLGGYWSLCGEPAPPYSPVREAGLSIVQAPATVTRDSGPVEVVAQPVTRCLGIRAPEVQATLSAASPLMQVHAMLRDNGQAPDSQGSDERYSAAVLNPFGPGVAAQTLTLSAQVLIDNGLEVATVDIELVEP